MYLRLLPLQSKYITTNYWSYINEACRKALSNLAVKFNVNITTYIKFNVRLPNQARGRLIAPNRAGCWYWTWQRSLMKICTYHLLVACGNILLACPFSFRISSLHIYSRFLGLTDGTLLDSNLMDNTLPDSSLTDGSSPDSMPNGRQLAR